MLQQNVNRSQDVEERHKTSYEIEGGPIKKRKMTWNSETFCHQFFFSISLKTQICRMCAFQKRNLGALLPSVISTLFSSVPLNCAFKKCTEGDPGDALLKSAVSSLLVCQCSQILTFNFTCGHQPASDSWCQSKLLQTLSIHFRRATFEKHLGSHTSTGN